MHGNSNIKWLGTLLCCGKWQLHQVKRLCIRESNNFLNLCCSFKVVKRHSIEMKVTEIITVLSLISSFSHKAEEIRAVLRYHAAYSVNSLLTFRGGGHVCPETSVNNYHYRMRNIPEERRSHNCDYMNIPSCGVKHVSNYKATALCLRTSSWFHLAFNFPSVFTLNGSLR